MKKKIFSIVTPVYQNEANLETTIPALLALQKKLKNYRLELVFVDDGSTDRSFELLERFARKHRGVVKVVKFTTNFSQTPATQAGLAHATGDCVGIISADLQDPPELFLEMLEAWEGGVPLVIAERTNREEGFLHRLVSQAYWRFVNELALPGFPAGGFDFCLLDRSLVNEVVKANEKNTSIFPLIFSFRFPHHKIPYTRSLRKAGKSQWTFGRKLALAMNTFVGFTFLPVRFISYFGVVISGLSLVYAAFVVFSYFVLGTRFPGWSSVITVISGLGGLILFTLGLIGEYVWRILDEVRGRPIYVVERRIGFD